MRNEKTQWCNILSVLLLSYSKKINNSRKCIHIQACDSVTVTYDITQKTTRLVVAGSLITKI